MKCNVYLPTLRQYIEDCKGMKAFNNICQEIYLIPSEECILTGEVLFCDVIISGNDAEVIYWTTQDSTLKSLEKERSADKKIEDNGIEKYTFLLNEKLGHRLLDMTVDWLDISFKKTDIVLVEYLDSVSQGKSFCGYRQDVETEQEFLVLSCENDVVYVKNTNKIMEYTLDKETENNMEAFSLYSKIKYVSFKCKGTCTNDCKLSDYDLIKNEEMKKLRNK